MAIRHHPDIATLMSCAAGSQPEALAAVVASHIAMCPGCAREVARLSEIGVALFDRLPEAKMRRPAPIVAARAGEADVGPAAAAASEGDVPPPLVPHVGTTRLDAIAWRPVAPGIADHAIPLSKGATGDLRLVKVAPGKKLPEHGHRGEELTLLLAGSYRDELGTFAVGDVADLDQEVEHQPVADATTGCICLVASEKKPRFKGFIARLLQPFIGF